MPTPLARLLRALGGGRLSPETLGRMPPGIIDCRNPGGPDFDLPLRAAFGDLTAEEERQYQAHCEVCPFCRELYRQTMQRDLSKLRAFLRDLGVHTKPRGEST